MCTQSGHADKHFILLRQQCGATAWQHIGISNNTLNNSLQQAGYKNLPKKNEHGNFFGQRLGNTFCTRPSYQLLHSCNSDASTQQQYDVTLLPNMTKQYSSTLMHDGILQCHLNWYNNRP